MKALITGITGQDGAYLATLLLNKGYEVYGTFRRTSQLHLERLKFLGVDDKVQFVPLELLEFTNIYRAIERIQPDEIYNLIEACSPGPYLELFARFCRPGWDQWGNEDVEGNSFRGVAKRKAHIDPQFMLLESPRGYSAVTKLRKA